MPATYDSAPRFRPLNRQAVNASAGPPSANDMLGPPPMQQDSPWNGGMGDAPPQIQPPNLGGPAGGVPQSPVVPQTPVVPQRPATPTLPNGRPVNLGTGEGPQSKPVILNPRTPALPGGIPTAKLPVTRPTPVDQKPVTGGGVIKPPPTLLPVNPKTPITPITPTTSPVGSNLRGDVYTPGDDPRLKSAQSATDAAGRAIQGYDRAGMQNANEDRYRSIYGTGAIDGSQYAVNGDVGFSGVNPNVSARDVNTQVGRGAAVDPTESARTAKYGTAQDAALDSLNGPDRTALATQKLKDFDATSDEQRFKEERALGQNIAKFGRSGLQGNADDFGEITRKIAGDRGRLANELASSVAEGDINDRFRRVDATAGLRGQEAGLDAQARGEQRTERDYGTGLDERNVGRALDDRAYRTGLDESNFGRAASERDTATGLAERNVGRRQSERDTQLGIATGNQDRAFQRTNAGLDRATNLTNSSVNDLYDRANAAGSLEDRVFGQGTSNRNEYRTERGRQDDQAQQTIENRLKEFQIQQELEDAKIRRAAALQQAGGIY